ncbi:MAG TPA: SDR family oxidoreductase [Blastocatellia bacterium]|nr:SDR family oxidoreductase [Blastocatellia bacterium]HMX29863.1 SDR family oxidoreductase [Blastocatellia bacterium]HMY73926.1 SDR family oxidoreductase [Blastocatellia bacterium]HMZ18273.1 SDR family oxidoreductase [Blastocatellia bacterium]HNG30972.1 SDR family oxidoreductase [Blastocatellia bacterium]
MNSTYLITGSTGIAAATIRLAVREGHAVFFVSHDEESCRALAEELQTENKLFGFHVADLTNPTAVTETIQRCVTRFGRIDALFNVAGISGRRFGDGPIHECSVEGWETTFANNVTTTFLMCREVVTQMLRQPLSETGLRGAIVNMASVLAVSPEAAHFATHAYAAGKGAIISLTKAMAAYYAPHKIRVNAVAPGLVRTPMSARAQQDAAILELMKTKQPLAEDLIEAEDIAAAALFLLGEQARFVTGEILSIDAGWRVSG